MFVNSKPNSLAAPLVDMISMTKYHRKGEL